MKRIYLSLLLTLVSIVSFSQVDTSSFEKKARYHLNEKIKGRTILSLSPRGLSATFNAAINLAATKVPFVTIAGLRAGVADTAAVVYIIDPSARGIFYYDPLSSDADDGSTVIVNGSRRYLKQVFGGGGDFSGDASEIVTGIVDPSRLPNTLLYSGNVATVTNKTLPFSGAGANTATGIPQGAIVGLADSLAKKLNKTQLATINGNRLDLGGNVTITAGGGGSVQSVTGNIVNNTDPNNPVVTGVAPGANISTFTNNAGYLITETDPGVPSAVKALSVGDISNWNNAYSLRHSHTNKTELDGVTAGLITNWNTAFTNNHTHPNKSTIDGISGTNITNWNTAFTWGNHASVGYATSSALSTAIAGREPTIVKGTVSQYFRGDMSLATFPTIPDASTFVSKTATENIGGVKTFTDNVTSRTIAPVADNTWNLGSAGFRYGSIFGNYFLGSVFGTATSGAAIDIRQGTESQVVAKFFPTTGNFKIQPKGVAQTVDSSYLFHVGGTARVNGVLTLGNTVLPATSSTQDIGTSSNRFNNMYAGSFMSGGTSRIGTTAASSSFGVRQGTTSQLIAFAFPTTGNWVFQAPAAAPTVDNGAKMTINGTTKINGGVFFHVDSIGDFTSNAAALAGGVPPGKLYKTVVDDEWILKIAHEPSGMPIYSEILGNLVTRTLFSGTSSERKYKSQKDPNASWGITKTSGGAGIPPVFRFEIRPGDVWPTDTVNGNDQNGQWKERAEMYDINTTTSLGYNTPWETVQWVSYRMYVEPGASVVYGNESYYTDLGQWHAKTGGGQATIKIDFRGQTEFRIYTHGGTVAGSGTPRDTIHLARGTWHKIVMRIKHSQSPTGGEFRMYINSSTPIINLTGIPLGIYGESDAGYWKYGIYRTAASDPNKVTLAVHYANMEISSSDLSGRITSPLPLVP